MKQFYKKYREIFQAEELTRTQKDIITILINRMEYHNGEPFYCYESWIAEEVKCSEKTVKRAVKHFEDIKLLTIDRHYNKQTRKTTNFYTIHINTNGSTLVNTDNVSGVVDDYEKEEIVEPSTPVVEEEQPRVFDWDSITGNDLVQMPVTNVDEFEYSTKTEEDYDEYYESDEYKEQLRKEEEYIINNNIEEKNINDMIDYSNTYIPDELVYNDAFSVDLKDCKRIDNTTPTINEDMLNNVKEWLIKNIGKNKQATIYYKALKEKYGYTFKEVVETAKELDRQNVITYAPVEKNGKLYHYYSLKRTSEAVEVEIIVDWLKYTTYRINQYKDECKQVPNAQEAFYKNIIDDVNNSLMGFIARGGDKKTLVNLFNQQFEQYRKVA
jgi:hypothetical protein